MSAFEQFLSAPTTAFYGLVLSAAALGFALEAVFSVAFRRKLFSWSDSAANIAMYAGYVAVAVVWVPVVFQLYTWVSDHALIRFTLGSWHIGNNGLWWEWIVLFVLEDLCFYGFHRASHRVRFLWASHVTHHSSNHFNLTVAFRQTWLPFTSVVFWLPLLLVGFDPLMVLSVQFVSLSYQELLHTQLVPSLGPIGWVFNTPAHHAVHHGRNADYIDKNYGGIFIVWDRLFGTFAARHEPVEFGITTELGSNNPLVIAFHEWWAMARGVVRSRSLWGLGREVFGPPERVGPLRGPRPGEVRGHADREGASQGSAQDDWQVVRDPAGVAIEIAE